MFKFNVLIMSYPSDCQGYGLLDAILELITKIIGAKYVPKLCICLYVLKFFTKIVMKYISNICSCQI